MQWMTDWNIFFELFNYMTSPNIALSPAKSEIGESLTPNSKEFNPSSARA